jgi:diguanylate cyclase (GGDEF)-like protein
LEAETVKSRACGDDGAAVSAVPDTQRLLGVIDFQNEIGRTRLDLREVMQRVAERAEALTAAAGAVVELAEAEDMVYRAATGTAAEHIGLRLRRATSLSGMCVALNEVLCCHDTENDSRVDRESCRRVGVGSMICVPLVHDGIAVGVLKVMAPDPNAFGADDVETLGLLSGLVAAHLTHAEAFEAVSRESRVDSLTGLANRRAYDERLRAEVDRAFRSDAPLSLCLFDLDGFKAVNDALGHMAGDAVLVAVARILRATRSTDDAFRIGGDEFALVLRDTSLESADVVVRRVRRAIHGERLGGGTVSASVGVAEADSDTPSSLHAAADARLYAAKQRLAGVR